MTLLPENNELTSIQEEKSGGNQLFPVFLKLNQLHTMLIGAGSVGLEKLRAILHNSREARVTVIAKSVIQGVYDLSVAYPSVKIIEKAFSDEDLDNVD